jgi:site-specific recombinase XerD
MTVAQVVEQYIQHKRSLGMRFSSQAVMLRAFGRQAGAIAMTAVSRDQVRAFLDRGGTATYYWRSKHSVLSGLYQYAIPRGLAVTNPLPAVLPKLPPRFVPYIYPETELRRLLETAASCCSSPHSVLDGDTLRTLLLLLYGAGLRISEALALTVTDVDQGEQLLTIYKSKFYKTRLVPIGPRLAGALAEYAKRREQRKNTSPSRAFFLDTTGQPVTRGQAETVFRRLRSLAGVVRRDGARYQPRLHDLRHTFAVHRLTCWYREGADVQRLLPKLSTYLGHVALSCTQRYLTMTPELLNEAGKRFEAYVGVGVGHG